MVSIENIVRCTLTLCTMLYALLNITAWHWLFVEYEPVGKIRMVNCEGLIPVLES